MEERIWLGEGPAFRLDVGSLRRARGCPPYVTYPVGVPEIIGTFFARARDPGVVVKFGVGSMPFLSSIALIFTFGLSVVSGDHGSASIAGYTPATDAVWDVSRLDLDLATIVEYLGSNRDQADYIEASKVYEFGGHSASYAFLRLVNLTATGSFSAGSKVVGPMHTTPGNTSVPGFVVGYLKDDAVWSSGAGTTDIIVEYDANSAAYVECSVGMLWAVFDADLGGCFDNTGTLMLYENENDDGWMFDYEYVEEIRSSNMNGRSLSDLSRLAERTMRPCSDEESTCDRHFINSFAPFADYYGEPDFADKWISALFAREPTGFQSGFGDANFAMLRTIAESRDRFSAIQYSVTTMTILHQVLREIEMAGHECSHGSKRSDNTQVVLAHLDKAVGYYSGSLEGSHGDGDGVFLYDLAANLCVTSKTCGHNADKQDDDAHVNYKVWEQFNGAKQAVQAGSCSLGSFRSEIARLVKIPLLQGLLLRSYEDKYGSASLVNVIEGATFAAAILPWLDRCDSAVAEEVYENMLWRNSLRDSNFEAVKSALESVYSCLDVSCREIGGLWDTDQGAYRQFAAPCDDGSLPVDKKDKHDERGDVEEKKDVTIDFSEAGKSAVEAFAITLFVFAGMAFVVAGAMRWKSKRRSSNMKSGVPNQLAEITEIC